MVPTCSCNVKAWLQRSFCQLVFLKVPENLEKDCKLATRVLVPATLYPSIFGFVLRSYLISSFLCSSKLPKRFSNIRLSLIQT
jgi:hypothetical protein